MSNREPDGRSTVVDYAKLGAPKVKALLDSGRTGWTPHQERLAREWLVNQQDNLSAESAKLARAGLGVSYRTFWATVIGVVVCLIAAVISYLAYRATP